MRFILASESPRRALQLKSIGVDFSAQASGVEEQNDGFYKPNIPFINAIAKAEAVAEKNPDALVLGADTVIEFEGEILGKPKSMDDAVNMLLKLSGKSHIAVSAVCLKNISNSMSCVFGDETKVVFRNFNRETAMKYARLTNPLDKAGSYAIQEHGDMIVESIDGSLENVIGLPLEKVKESLYALGFGNFIRKRSPSENWRS